MKKIAVYIADQQHIRLKALAEGLGVTQAELLRQFLEEGLRHMERDVIGQHALHRKAEGREDSG
jgi:predicted DNA-binding protein